MAEALSWLPEVLREAGLKVAEQPGWLTRGAADMEVVRGVICHHTGGARAGNMPSLKALTHGVVQKNGKRLSGPLAQLGLGRDGTFYVVSARRCNHAGEGVWQEIRTGNSSFIGIEAENVGNATEPWPEVQLDAYRRGVAAILKRVGATADFCCAHREYALPAGRKPDPHSIDMNEFRKQVAALMAGTGAITHPVIHARDAAGRATLLRGMRGEAVKIVQAAVGVAPDGVFGPATEAAVRAFQIAHGLVPDGRVGPKSWAQIPGADMAIPARVAEIGEGPGASQAALAWGRKVSRAFRDRVFSICRELAINPDYLMACMAFETGETFSPSIVNAAGSHAIGLIQFMPQTALALGSSTEALGAMSAEDQLLYVRKYFLPQKGRLHNLGDVYMAILWPAAIGKPDDHAMFVEGQEPVRRYLQNRGLDFDHDGIVTRAEACAAVERKLERGMAEENFYRPA